VNLGALQGDKSVIIPSMTFTKDNIDQFIF
jgi:hypothetical protein